MNINQKYLIIHSIVDEEVYKSMDEFQYQIEGVDIELEKRIFKTIIFPIWKNIEESSNIEYSQLMRNVFSEIENQFRYKYYRNRDKNLDVKNNYQVHICSIVYKIFTVLSNKLYDKYLVPLN